MPEKHYVRWFKELSIGDVPLVGGKNASLGEMVRELVPLGVRVPNGFAVTARPSGMRSPRRMPGPGCTQHWTGSTRAMCGRLPVPEPAAARSSTPLACRGRRKPRCWRRTWSCRRSTGRTFGGGPQLGHGRGPADGELRRPARELPERARGGTAAGCRAPLPGLAVHRPGDLLPDRQGLRPLQGRPLGRRAEDGPLGPRKLGRDVLGRHRDRLQGRGVHHRCLGHRRERGPGCGRRGRVLRPQAHLPARLPLRAAPCPGCQEDQDGLCRKGAPASRWSTGRRARRSGAASASPTSRCCSSPTMPSASRITTPGTPAGPRPWTSSGPWTAWTISSTSSRPGRRR